MIRGFIFSGFALSLALSGTLAAEPNATFTWSGNDAQVFISALMDGNAQVRDYVLGNSGKDINIHLTNMIIRKASTDKYDTDDPHYGFIEVSSNGNANNKALKFTESLALSYLMKKNGVELDCDMGGCNYELADVSCNIHLNTDITDKRYSCDFIMVE